MGEVGGLCTNKHSKKKPSVQVVHVRRDARSAQEIVTLRASPSSVQESAQEIPVVCNLETLRNCPLSCCEIGWDGGGGRALSRHAMHMAAGCAWSPLSTLWCQRGFLL